MISLVDSQSQPTGASCGAGKYYPAFPEKETTTVVPSSEIHVLPFQPLFEMLKDGMIHGDGSSAPC